MKKDKRFGPFTKKSQKDGKSQRFQSRKHFEISIYCFFLSHVCFGCGQKASNNMKKKEANQPTKSHRNEEPYDSIISREFSSATEIQQARS